MSKAWYTTHDEQSEGIQFIFHVIYVDVAVEVLSSVVPTRRKCLDTNYAMVVSRWGYCGNATYV